jgi:drug/metabolite transporter (DMT)-like permease
MEPLVFAAVIAAAAMHAGWNSFLKVSLEPFLAMTLVSAMAGVAAVPLLVAFGWPRAEAWPWLIGSLITHLAYYGALTEAYRRADMSQIYPIARGGAPLLTAVFSRFFVTEPLSAVALTGIFALGSGVALMSILGRRRGAAFDGVAVALALLTAAVICAYTIIDGVGARAAGDPHAYSAALFVLDGLPLPLLALWRRGASGLAPAMKYWKLGLAGGAMALGSYWTAIWAMTVAPIALVAALRESSVLWAAVIAVAFLKEPILRPRAVAAAMILSGIVLIRLQ